MEQTRIDAAATLPCGQMRRVDVRGKLVCVAHVEDGAFFAFDDTCSHGAYSLSEGYLEGREVECMMHGSLFDVSTGQPLNPPAAVPVQTYEVTVDGEDLLLTIPEG